jgi:CHAD domain-containing protein
MKTKKLQRLVKGYTDAISAAAAKVGDGFDEDVIHGLRVNVKRLRALLRMYWLYKGRARPALPKRLGQVYKAAGEVRDLQLLLRRTAGKGNLPEVYRHKIEEQLLLAKQAWSDAYIPAKLEKACEKLVTHVYKPVPAFMPAEFMKERLGLIDELRAAGTLDDEDVHTVRKRVKDIIYVVRLVNDHWAKACGVIEHVPLHKFEELADAIGALNDTRQASERLSRIKVRGSKAGDIAARRKYITRLDKELTNIRKKAFELLADLHGEIFS